MVQNLIFTFLFILTCPLCVFANTCFDGREATVSLSSLDVSDLAYDDSFILSGDERLGDVNGDGIQDTLFTPRRVTYGYSSTQRFPIYSGQNGSLITEIIPATTLQEANFYDSQTRIFNSAFLISSSHFIGVRDVDGDGKRDLLQASLVNTYVGHIGSYPQFQNHTLLHFYSTATGNLIREDRLLIDDFKAVTPFIDITGSQYVDFILEDAHYSSTFASLTGLPYINNSHDSVDLVIDGQHFLEFYLLDDLTRTSSFLPSRSSRAYMHVRNFPGNSDYDSVLVTSKRTQNFSDGFDLTLTFFHSDTGSVFRTVELPHISYNFKLEFLNDLDGDSVGEPVLNRYLVDNPSKTLILSSSRLALSSDASPLLSIDLPTNAGTKALRNVTVIHDIDQDGTLDIFSNSPSRTYVFSGSSGELLYDSGLISAQYFIDGSARFSTFDPLGNAGSTGSDSSKVTYLGVITGQRAIDKYNYTGGQVTTSLVAIGTKPCGSADDSSTDTPSTPVGPTTQDPSQQDRPESFESLTELATYLLDSILSNLSPGTKLIPQRPDTSGLTAKVRKKKLKRWKKKKATVKAAQRIISEALPELPSTSSDLEVATTYPSLTPDNLARLQRFFKRGVRGRNIKKKKKNLKKFKTLFLSVR